MLGGDDHGKKAAVYYNLTTTGALELRPLVLLEPLLLLLESDDGGRLSGSAKRVQLGPSRMRASSWGGRIWSRSTPGTPAAGAWLARDGPVRLLLPTSQQTGERGEGDQRATVPHPTMQVDVLGYEAGCIY